MNKARIMLSALGVLAVVGSTLAFKAHKNYNGNLRCSVNTTNSNGVPGPDQLCTQSSYETTTTITAPFRFCTEIGEPANEPCVRARVLSVQ